MEDLRLVALAIILPITFYTELSEGKIYNWMTLPAIGLGLFLAGLMGWNPFLDSVWGAVLGGGIFFLPYLIAGLSRGRPVMGGGDVKLATAIGALTGPSFVLQVIWWGGLVGGLIGLGVIGWKVFVARASEPESGKAPLSQALMVRIPFGTALCMGVAIAFTLQYLV